jgi:hypothetical protein
LDILLTGQLTGRHVQVFDLTKVYNMLSDDEIAVAPVHVRCHTLQAEAWLFPTIQLQVTICKLSKCV